MVIGPHRWASAARILLPVALVLAGLVFIFRGAILNGLVFYESDTIVYYYPILTELRRSLLSGTLPLWTPYIYGGFPLFADGESGALYPVNLVLLLLMPPEGALLWLGPVRLAMASFFMFLFVRSIGLGRLGALVAGLVFAFGGFTIAQLHHVNLSNGAVWLPLILLFVERTVQREGAARLRALLLAGVAFAVQGLALHVQISLMTMLFVGLYVAFRFLAFPAGALIRRAGLAAASIAGTIGLGLGLVAVQWIPLLELSRFSPRAPGLVYSQALEYSLPPINLITLFSPYFFREGQRIWWAVWSPWETIVYVGIAPLLLAAVALVWVRSRWTAFFGGTALLALLVAMANYLPLNLHYWLYRLPWFDALRAPGRFSYLFTFSVACLAGFGVHWLAGRPELTRPRGFWILPAGFLGLLAILLAGMQWLNGWLVLNKELAAETIGRFYLSLGPSALPHLTRFDVIDFLKYSSELLNWRGQIGLALASGALLLAWVWLPRGRRLIVVGLVLVVSVDLLRFGQDFHDTIPVVKIAPDAPAVKFLAQKAGSERVFNIGSQLAEPNRLAPFMIQAAGGYSSLPFQRHRQYRASALYLQRPLADLWNVRYVMANQRPSYGYRGLSFDPVAPLFSGGQGIVQRFNVPDIPTTEVRLLSAQRRAPDIPQGSIVGNLILRDVSGAQQRIPLVAGIHTGEWAYDREDVLPYVRHQRPELATTLRQFDPNGVPFQANIYFASVNLPNPMSVSGMSIEYVYPIGILEVYTVELAGPGDRKFQVRPYNLEKYRQVYQEDAVAIYESQSVLPRAFLVPKAVSFPNESALLLRLNAPDFDPWSEILLEGQVSAPQGASSRAPGQATITSYEDLRVIVATENPEPAFLFLGDSYYPGWKAFLDGDEVTIYRANYLFRAVALPPGRHTVEFRYEPASFALGIWISGAVAGITILLAGGSWLARLRRQFRSN